VKFLVDEDVPVKLLKMLVAAGHDAVRVPASTKDRDIARQAASQVRILVTLDKDFTNRLLYPPLTSNIIYIRIHPPFADDLIAAMQQLLKEIPEPVLKGLIVLQRDGHMRIAE
jgi:predicted nuclease of predicted toxin-antitoxin system